MICSQSIPEHCLAQGCEHALGQLVVPFQLYQPLGAPALLYGQGMQGQSADLLYAIYLGSRCTYTYGRCRQTQSAEVLYGLWRYIGLAGAASAVP